MKVNDRLRQKQKLYRHGAKKGQMPTVRRRASKVVGKLLPALPGVPAMLDEIREQFDMSLVSAGEDIEEQLAPGQAIDWPAVRREVEASAAKQLSTMSGSYETAAYKTAENIYQQIFTASEYQWMTEAEVAQQNQAMLEMLQACR